MSTDSRPQVIAPLDYDSIIALAEKTGVKLTPFSFPRNYPKCCVISLFAIANKDNRNFCYLDDDGASPDYSETQDYLFRLPNGRAYAALEGGFENYTPEDVYENDMVHYNTGQRLRAYALAQQEK